MLKPLQNVVSWQNHARRNALGAVCTRSARKNAAPPATEQSATKSATNFWSVDTAVRHTAANSASVQDCPATFLKYETAIYYTLKRPSPPVR